MAAPVNERNQARKQTQGMSEAPSAGCLSSWRDRRERELGWRGRARGISISWPRFGPGLCWVCRMLLEAVDVPETGSSTHERVECRAAGCLMKQAGRFVNDKTRGLRMRKCSEGCEGELYGSSSQV